MIAQTPSIDSYNILQYLLYVLPRGNSLSVHLLTLSVVEVNFNEDSYTVAESDGQVSISIRIDGQFFVPVWAIVDISDGTATGGLCKYIGYTHLCI